MMTDDTACDGRDVQAEPNDSVIAGCPPFTVSNTVQCTQIANVQVKF